MTGNSNRERLERLLDFLETDPENPSLLRETAQAALAADDPAKANEMFVLLNAVNDLSPADSNLWAIAAMRSGQPVKAAETFASLLKLEPDNLEIKFNLAWAKALAGDREGAREMLTQDVVERLPQAATLEVNLLHDAGEFEPAVERANDSLQRHPDYPPLLAAVSVLAMDVDDVELARSCAQKAGDHPDALTTLAMLNLGEQDASRAKSMFELALSMNDHLPRAWVGLGLANLAQGDPMKAGENIDRGAEIFGDHLGSWIAAGWAYLCAGDHQAARERFGHAAELDDNFAEAQGSLAVMEILAGETEEGRRRTQLALRLDRQCFSAAFANVLLQVADGDTDNASRIMNATLQQPIDAEGRTIADAIAGMARGGFSPDRRP